MYYQPFVHYDELSEISYPLLCTGREFTTFVHFISFNVNWMVLVNVCNLLLFYTVSFRYMFDWTPRFHPYIYEAPLFLVLVFDYVSSVIHRYRTSVSNSYSYRPISIFYMFTMGSLLTATAAISFMHSTEKYMLWIHFGVIALRCFVKQCQFITYSYYDGRVKLYIHMFTSYLFMIALFVQIFACIWFKTCSSCLYNIATPTHYAMSTRTIQDNIYMINIFYILGGMTHIGYGGASLRSNSEQIVLIVLALLSVALIRGGLFASLAMRRMSAYSLENEKNFLTRIINKELDNEMIKYPKPLRRDISQFCKNFLYKKICLRQPELICVLPQPLIAEMFTCMYRVMFWQSFLLRSVPECLHRTLAQRVTVRTFTPGETIFDTATLCGRMIFLAEGSMHIMCPEDLESPIITLGVGTCAGSLYLVYGRKPRYALVAATFSTVHMLVSTDFWRAHTEACWHGSVSNKLHAVVRRKLRSAKADMAFRVTYKMPPLTVQEVKDNLTQEIVMWRNTYDINQKGPYPMSKTVARLEDRVFLRTKWVWRLRPDSMLLQYWTYLMITMTLVVAITYPLLVTFPEVCPAVFLTLELLVLILFPMDVFVKTITATRSAHGFELHFRQIFNARIVTWHYQVDIIAAVPVSLVCLIMRDVGLLTMNDIVFDIIRLSHVIKAVKLRYYFKSYADDPVFIIFKYVVYFLYLNYFWTCIYFIFFDRQTDGNWLSTIPAKSLLPRFITIYNYIFAMMSLSDSFAFNSISEMYFIMLVSVFAFCFYIYVLSSVTGIIMTTCKYTTEYLNHIDVLLKYVNYYKVSTSLQQRIREYLILQRHFHPNDYSENSDQFLAQNIIREIKTGRFFDTLVDQKLFSTLSTDLIEQLSMKCEPIFSPPNDVVVNEGQHIRQFYIIEKGYCEIHSSAQPTVIKVLGPKDSFCMLEMILNQKSHYSYRAVTHISLIVLKFSVIDNLLREADPTMHRNIHEIAAQLRDTPAMKRIFISTMEAPLAKFGSESGDSWMVFSNIKKHASYIDYRRALRKAYIARICKYLLMRKTIRPQGTFIKHYEIYFSIFIIIMTIAYPLIIVFTSGSKWWFVFYIMLYFFASIDLYLRFHMCYYNADGILVSHPWCTAVHFLKTSFLVEMYAYLPIELLLHVTPVYQNAQLSPTHVAKLLFSFNKFIYLYRYKGFHYVRNTYLQEMSVFALLLTVVPIIMVVLNSLTICFIYWNLQFITTELTTSLNATWVRDNIDRHQSAQEILENIDLLDLYAAGFFWITMNMLSCPMLSVLRFATAASEITLTTCSMLFGYFTFLLLLAVTICIYNKQNTILIENQLNGVDFDSFMKLARLQARFRIWVFSHFEHTWNRTRGVRMDILNNCHDTLKENCMSELYAKFFHTIAVFKMFANTVAKVIGPHFRVVYFLRREIIIEQNDVISKLYIVLDGEILVYNALNTIQDVLYAGSIFGNIDNCQYTRNMVQYVSKTNVELLVIDTGLFYEFLKEIPDVASRIEQRIIRRNASYIRNNDEDYKSRFEDTINTLTMTFSRAQMTWQKLKIKILTPVRWLLELCTFASTYWTFYLFGFSRGGLVPLTIFYVFDLLYVANVVLSIWIPRCNDFGNYMSMQEVLRWFVRRRLPLAICALLPLELIPITFMDGEWVNAFRLNRLLRTINFLYFVSEHFKALKVDILLLNCMFFIAEVSFFIHSCACLLYFIACPNGICQRPSWLLSTTGERCSNRYLCAIYYATSIFTQTGFSTIVPATSDDRMACAVVALISRILLFISIGQVFVAVKYITFAKMTFNYKFSKVEKYVMVTTLTDAIAEKIFFYLKNLWTYQRGNQLPVLFDQMPWYMRIALKTLIYGENIFNNIVFEGCHPDFIRQLMEHVRVQTFFAGDVICDEDELNHTMYFIWQGVVEVISPVSINEETIIDELSTSDTFGVVQGLFECRPHLFKFRAKQVSTILSLKYTDWEHLLMFFPQSAYAIYDKFSVGIQEVPNL